MVRQLSQWHCLFWASEISPANVTITGLPGVHLFGTGGPPASCKNRTAPSVLTATASAFQKCAWNLEDVVTKIISSQSGFENFPFMKPIHTKYLFMSMSTLAFLFYSNINFNLLLIQ